MMTIIWPMTAWPLTHMTLVLDEAEVAAAFIQHLVQPWSSTAATVTACRVRLALTGTELLMYSNHAVNFILGDLRRKEDSCFVLYSATICRRRRTAALCPFLSSRYQPAFILDHWDPFCISTRSYSVSAIRTASAALLYLTVLHFFCQAYLIMAKCMNEWVSE